MDKIFPLRRTTTCRGSCNLGLVYHFAVYHCDEAFRPNGGHGICRPTEGTKPTAPTGKPNTPATGDPAAAGLFAGIFFLALGMAVLLPHTRGKKRSG